MFCDNDVSVQPALTRCDYETTLEINTESFGVVLVPTEICIQDFVTCEGTLIQSPLCSSYPDIESYADDIQDWLTQLGYSTSVTFVRSNNIEYGWDMTIRISQSLCKVTSLLFGYATEQGGNLEQEVLTFDESCPQAAQVPQTITFVDTESQSSLCPITYPVSLNALIVGGEIVPLDVGPLEIFQNESELIAALDAAIGGNFEGGICEYVTDAPEGAPLTGQIHLCVEPPCSEGDDVLSYPTPPPNAGVAGGIASYPSLISQGVWTLPQLCAFEWNAYRYVQEWPWFDVDAELEWFKDNCDSCGKIVAFSRPDFLTYELLDLSSPGALRPDEKIGTLIPYPSASTHLPVDDAQPWATSHGQLLSAGWTADASFLAATNNGADITNPYLFFFDNAQKIFSIGKDQMNLADPEWRTAIKDYYVAMMALHPLVDAIAIQLPQKINLHQNTASNAEHEKFEGTEPWDINTNDPPIPASNNYDSRRQNIPGSGIYEAVEAAALLMEELRADLPADKMVVADLQSGPVDTWRYGGYQVGYVLGYQTANPGATEEEALDAWRDRMTGLATSMDAVIAPDDDVPSDFPAPWLDDIRAVTCQKTGRWIKRSPIPQTP